MYLFTDTLCAVARNAIMSLVRTHNLPLWSEEDYWWFGLTNAWSTPWWPTAGTKPVSGQALRQALLGLGIPESSFHKPGAHTILELDNLSFVYREKRFKNGRVAFRIAPHKKGVGFGRCGHSFMDAYGSALDWAQCLVEMDRAVPALKSSGIQAFKDGLQERRIREIKLETARVFLLDFFKGELPSAIVAYEISDSAPGACDLIRLTIHDEGTPFWRTRLFDIPYEMRNYLLADDVQTFIDECGLQFGALEMFEDEETGIKYPITSYRPYLSETEKEGLLDE